MKNADSIGHVRGASVYLDDIPTIRGTAYGQVFASPCAHGAIVSIDYTRAAAVPGVLGILTCRDIPGQNQIGGIIPDEPLFAESELHYCGQPIALVIAESDLIARKACNLIELRYAEKPVITDPREAQQKGELIQPPRTFRLGNTAAAWTGCARVFEGRADTNGQEHLYIETQGAYAVPMENGHIRIHSSTQGPTAVQRTAARVLGVPMHRIEVDVTRLGGGFGGKEDQATAWGVMAALAARHLNRPVKVVLSRTDDMHLTGKRHPYSADYKIGLSADLKILAYEVTFYQNAGAAADLSPAVLERTLFHCTNAYFIPNVLATAYSCRTNLPPNTAFRGFGGPQGMFVIEAALAHAAEAMGVPKRVLQEKNLLQNGDEFPYGQIADGLDLPRIWQTADSKFDIGQAAAAAEQFNRTHTHRKKGLSLMPVCFGISFTKTPMNQARALVHIYSDGSIGVSTGAVEMGQGVNPKMLQVAARVFSVSPARVKLESTNTTRIANTSPSAASATADLNGKALEQACTTLLERLKACAAKQLDASASDITLANEQVLLCGQPTSLDWPRLIETAFLERINLSEHSHYATPVIRFDKTIEKGHPFAYHVCGLALTVVELDCIRGTYTFDSVKIVHDFGQSMNMLIDRGQVEGGLLQGIGWMTIEELRYDAAGRLLSGSLSTYKVPDLYSAPAEVQIEALDSSGSDLAIFKSKAVGEPPLMYGIGAYFAIQEAIKAFNGQRPLVFDAPFTHEKVLMALYGNLEWNTNSPTSSGAD